MNRTDVEDTEKEKKQRHIALLKSAMAEFEDNGRVLRVKCDDCDGLIEITALSDTAWSVRCPCGTFNDTLRGI